LSFDKPYYWKLDLKPFEDVEYEYKPTWLRLKFEEKEEKIQLTLI